MYEVGINLKLNENLETKLRPVLALVEKLNSQFANLERNLSRISRLTGTANKEFSVMNTELRNMSRNSRSLNSLARDMDHVTRSASRAKTELNKMNMAAGGSGGGGRHRGGMFFGGGGFEGIGGRLLNMGITGSMGVLGAEALFGMGKSIAGPGIEAARIRNQMTLTGWGQGDISRAEAEASNIRKTVPGISKLEVLKGMLETKSLFGSTGAAVGHARELAEAELIMRAVGESSGLKGDPKEHARAMVKSAEMLGMVSKRNDFHSTLGSLINASVLSGGRVTPEMLQQQLGTEGSARYLMDPMANLLYLTHFAQETATGKGGGRGKAGVIMSTALQTLMGGTMSKAAAQSLANIGLLDTELKAGKKGDLALSVISGPVKDAQLLRNDPLGWAAKDIIPQIKKQYPQWDALSEQNQALVFSKMFQGLPKNTRTFLSEITLSNTRSNIQRQIDQRHGLPTGQDRFSQAINDPANRMKAVSASWENLLVELGKNKLAATLASGALKGLTRFIDGLTRIAMTFNKFSDRVSHSSNTLNRAFGAVGHTMEALVKVIWGVVSRLASIIGQSVGMINSIGKAGGLMGAISNPGAFASKAAPGIIGGLSGIFNNVNGIGGVINRLGHDFNVANDIATGHGPHGGGGINPFTTSLATVGGNAPVDTFQLNKAKNAVAAVHAAHTAGNRHTGHTGHARTIVISTNEVRLQNGHLASQSSSVKTIKIENHFHGGAHEAKKHAEVIHNQLKKAMVRDQRQQMISMSSGGGNYQSSYFATG